MIDIDAMAAEISPVIAHGSHVTSDAAIRGADRKRARVREMLAEAYAAGASGDRVTATKRRFRVDTDSLPDAVRLLVEQFLASPEDKSIGEFQNMNKLPDGSTYKIAIVRESNVPKRRRHKPTTFTP